MRIFIGVVAALAALAGGYWGYNEFLAPAEAAGKAAKGGAIAADAELAKFAALASSAPKGAAAVQDDFTALADALSAFATVTYGSVEAEGAGAVAKDVVIASKANGDAGARIKELRLYGADAAALKSYASGATGDAGARIADRIDAKGVEWFGLDKLTQDVTDGYADAFENAIKGAAPDAETSIDVSTEITRYDLGAARMVVDGLTLHQWVAPPPQKEAADESDKSFKAMARMFMTAAAANRMISADALVMENLNGAVEFVQPTGQTSFKTSAPLMGVKGLRRGDLDFMAMKDFSYESRSEVSRAAPGATEAEAILANANGPMVMDMSAGAASYSIEGIRLAKLYEHLAAGKAPPMSETDLMSLGVWRIKGERQSFGGNVVATTREGMTDLSHFNWLIPTDVRFKADGISYNVAAVISWVRGMTPADAADAEKTQRMFDDMIASLNKVGLAEIKGDLDMTLKWNPKAGDTASGLVMDFAELARLEQDFDGGLASYAELEALAPEGEGVELEKMLAALFQKTTIGGYMLTLADDGGIAKSFAAAVEMAKFAPEDDAGAAMLRNAKPEDLRISSAAMIRLSGSQAPLPSASQYANAIGDFVQNGGALTIKLDPPKPLTLAELQATWAAAPTDPAGFETKLGLSVTHTPPKKK